LIEPGREGIISAWGSRKGGAGEEKDLEEFDGAEKEGEK